VLGKYLRAQQVVPLRALTGQDVRWHCQLEPESAAGRSIFLVHAAADHEVIDFAGAEDDIFFLAEEDNALRAQPILALELNMILHPLPATLKFVYPDRTAFLFIALHYFPAVLLDFRAHHSP
jgi:hypothetical protein